MEIEKKFLLEELPERLYAYPSVAIEQGYIVITASEELRIRKKGRALLLTFKKGTGTTRHEIEIDISEEQYDDFKQCVVGSTILKTRINYPYREHTVEIDIYKGALEGLITAEVEFSSPQDMQEFSPPSWFGKDVSLDDEFKNKSLALHGFPASLLRQWKETSRPPWHFKQSGVVPYRDAEAGREVLLITTRRSGKWVIPKGIIEPDLSPVDSARKEALEEAGVRGTVREDIEESYSYDKWGGRCGVELFPLQVTEQLASWPEEALRRREWVPQGHLAEYLENEELKEAVLRILRRLPENVEPG
ncbi:MAG: NUDIX domain-containing protein [Actinobacteria bacterium]|nr:NUDIX domain-containing protein [Actinomycetota bacterium]